MLGTREIVTELLRTKRTLVRNAPRPDSDPLDLAALDHLLADVIRDNPKKVAGWMVGEAGCWGFLAGMAVSSCRTQLGRPLAVPERRLVWRSLWILLEQVKAESSSSG